jgi:hypothetical protein
MCEFGILPYLPGVPAAGTPEVIFTYPAFFTYVKTVIYETSYMKMTCVCLAYFVHIYAYFCILTY